MQRRHGYSSHFAGQGSIENTQAFYLDDLAIQGDECQMVSCLPATTSPNLNSTTDDDAYNGTTEAEMILWLFMKTIYGLQTALG